MPDDFATTMRELSAAAVGRDQPRSSQELAALMREFHLLNATVQSLESVLTRRIENIANNVLPAQVAETASQFQKIEEHLQAIRTRESVNQRLFDSLHDELLKYRDNFLHESLHKPFVRDLIILFDDLIALSDQLISTSSRGDIPDQFAQWRGNLEPALHALSVILHRLAVTES